MAGEAQTIKAQVFMPGREGSRGMQPQLTLKKVSEWIRLQGLDEYTTEGLIELAGRYPTQALPSFKKNFNLMIQRVRQKRKQELGQLEPPVEEIEEKIDAESQDSVGGEADEQLVDDQVTEDGDGSTIVYA